MEEKFDAYFEWLGIPPDEQPPNCYRLPGIPLFVDAPNVISNAADRQMTHLRTFQTGKHGAECQRLLNEVATAPLGVRPVSGTKRPLILDARQPGHGQGQRRRRRGRAVYARNDRGD